MTHEFELTFGIFTHHTLLHYNLEKVLYLQLIILFWQHGLHNFNLFIHCNSWWIKLTSRVQKFIFPLLNKMVGGPYQYKTTWGISNILLCNRNGPNMNSVYTLQHCCPKNTQGFLNNMDNIHSFQTYVPEPHLQPNLLLTLVCMNNPMLSNPLACQGGRDTVVAPVTIPASPIIIK